MASNTLADSDNVNVLIRTTAWGGGSCCLTTHIVVMSYYDYKHRDRDNSRRSSSGVYGTCTEMILLGENQECL